MIEEAFSCACETTEVKVVVDKWICCGLILFLVVIFFNHFFFFFFSNQFKFL